MNELFPATAQSAELAAPLEVSPPSVVEAMTRAEIDIQVSTAKRYPRDYSVVKRKMITLATLDVETAESCFYKLSRQGKSIEGPSARLAEIAASCFGNMRAAAQVVDNDGKTITARGICHDLETNSCFAVEVKRRITGRDGRTFSDDMQVVTGNAACSIALRNAIFKTVPFALIKPVYEQARQAAVGDIKTLAERRTRMLKAFAALGVNEARILAALGKPGAEDIGLAELESLIGTHTAIKDGEQSVDEAFPAVPSKPALPKPAASKPTEQSQTPTAADTGTSATNVVPATATTQAEPLDYFEAVKALCKENGLEIDEVNRWTTETYGKPIMNLTDKQTKQVHEGFERMKADILKARGGQA